MASSPGRKVMKTAAIWARVSSIGQAELSPDGQIERVKTKLDEMGYFVLPDNIIKTVWTSTDLRPCPEFQKLLSLIHNHKIQAVGMLDRDRIEASGLQRLNFLAECKENGVTPIVYQGVSFLEGGEGQLVELALALAKEKQVQRAQSGAKQGLADRARLKNKPPTIAKIYGMNGTDGIYRPDTNYENACLIFRLWFEHEKLDTVAQELHKQGIATPRGNVLWTSSSLSNILKNPIYTGKIATLKYERRLPKNRFRDTFGKTTAKLKPESEWHWLPNNLVEKPIITWSEHEAIIDKLKANALRASRNAKHDYLLRGHIMCMLDGHRYFAVSRKDSNDKPKYYCNKHYAYTGPDKCQSVPLDMNALDFTVKQKIKAFLLDPSVSDLKLKEYADVESTSIESIENEIKEHQKQYQDTISAEVRYADMLTPEAFQSKQSLLKAQRAWLIEEINRKQNEIEKLKTITVKKDMVDSLRERLKTNLENATDEDWRIILDTLDVKVLAFGDGTWDIEISYNDVEPNTQIAYKTGWNTSP